MPPPMDFVGWWWMVVDLFWVVVGVGECFWAVVGGDGSILGGGGCWWIYFG